MSGRIKFGHILPGTWLQLRPTDKDRPGIVLLLYLLVITTVACSGGCMQCYELTNDFACALDACSLDGCLQTNPADRCAAAPTESESGAKKQCAMDLAKVKIGSLCRHFKGKAKHHKRGTEPMVAYEPPRPPKFLLVPTREVFSRVNMMAPSQRRGDVEVGFGPQLDMPGHD